MNPEKWPKKTTSLLKFFPIFTNFVTFNNPYFSLNDEDQEKYGLLNVIFSLFYSSDSHIHT